MSITKVEFRDKKGLGFEGHHSIPTKDGGKDEPENIVYIDYISHKITQGIGNPTEEQIIRVAKSIYDYNKSYINRQGYYLEDILEMYLRKRRKKGSKKIKNNKLYPPFKHDGNKGELFNETVNFRQYLPKDFSSYEEYIEPFAGSAGVFYRLVDDGTLKPEQHHIILNDYDIITYTMQRGSMECEPEEILEIWRNTEKEIKENGFLDNEYGYWMYTGDKKTGRPKINERDYMNQKRFLNDIWKEVQKKLNEKAYKDPEVVANLMMFKSYCFDGDMYNKQIGKNLDLSKIGHTNLIKGGATYPKYKNNIKPLHEKLNEFKDGAGIEFLNCDYSKNCEKLYDVKPFKSFWYIDPPYIGTTVKYESKNITQRGFVDLLYKLHEIYAHWTFSIDAGTRSGYDNILKEIKYQVKTRENEKYDIKILKALDKNIKPHIYSKKSGYQSYNSTQTKTMKTDTKERLEGVFTNWE